MKNQPFIVPTLEQWTEFCYKISNKDGIRKKINIRTIACKMRFEHYSELNQFVPIGCKLTSDYYIKKTYNKYINHKFKDKKSSLNIDIKNNRPQFSPKNALLELEIRRLKDEQTILRTEIKMLRNDFLNKTKCVHRFIREWNGDNTNVN